jgi:MarR family transcriptional regulator, organic hydroperoxide resistance regulator
LPHRRCGGHEPGRAEIVTPVRKERVVAGANAAGEGAEDPAAEALLHDLLQLEFVLSSQIRALAKQVLGGLGLTAPLADALWQLGLAQHAPPMGELAASLGVDPSSVTFLADRLEARGLVERQVNPANRRSTALVLTPEGARVRRELVKAIAARSPMRRLSTAEQRQLLHLLAKATRDSPEGDGA